MLRLFAKNEIFSSLWEDNNSFAIRSSIKIMAPRIPKDATIPAVEVETTVLVEVETTVVVVVVTVVIISSFTS